MAHPLLAGFSAERSEATRPGDPHGAAAVCPSHLSWISRIFASSTASPAPTLRARAFSLLSTFFLVSRGTEEQGKIPQLLLKGVADTSTEVRTAVAREVGHLACCCAGFGRMGSSLATGSGIHPRCPCSHCDKHLSSPGEEASPPREKIPRLVQRNAARPSAEWEPYLPLLDSTQPDEVRVLFVRSLQRIIAHTLPEDLDFEKPLPARCFSLIKDRSKEIQDELGFVYLLFFVFVCFLFFLFFLLKTRKKKSLQIHI